MKKLSLLALATGLFISQGVFSAPCLVDHGQMYAQIFKYKSISTIGCPLTNGRGIVKVTNVFPSSAGICTASCSYALGVVPKRRSCSWVMGNWDNTLTCY